MSLKPPLWFIFVTMMSSAHGSLVNRGFSNERGFWQAQRQLKCELLRCRSRPLVVDFGHPMYSRLTARGA